MENVNDLSMARVDAVRMQLRNEMGLQLPTWELAARYIAPRRLKADGQPKQDGSRGDHHIIRNTAGRSLRTFVSGMMNGATPRARPWFDLVTSNPADSEHSKVRNYLQASEKVLQSSLQVSNFYRVLPLAYKDVGIFSNAAFAMLPHARFGFYFYPYTIGSYGFSCDSEGNTVMFSRDTILTVRQVVENFTQLNDAGRIDWRGIEPAVKAAWESARYLDEVKIAQVILPNPHYNPVTAAQSLDPRAKKFQSYTYVLGMGGSAAGIPYQGGNGFRDQQGQAEGEPREFLRISGYNYFPVITPRWEIEPEGNYGIDGPGLIALSDIITLQEQEKLRLEGINKLVRPPMVGHAALRRHQSSILAGGITYLDDRAMNMGFKPAFQIGPALADLVQNQREVEEAIKSAFFEDIFMMLSGNEPKSHVTAAEVNERSSERMAILAPILGQWDFDLSSKVISNGIQILEDMGRLPPRPREMRSDVRPEYTSILAQAAKAAQVTTQERFSNFLSSYAQASGNPTLVKIANDEKFVREYADNIGLNPELLRSEAEYAELIESAARAQEQQAEFARAQAQAQTAKTLSETPVNNGSMLDTMSQMRGE